MGRFLLIGFFAASWPVTMLIYRLKRYDEIEAMGERAA